MSEASPQSSDEKPATNVSESDRSILKFAGRALITVIVAAILTTMATRREYLCPVCQGTKDVVAWHTLWIVPLSESEENLNEPAAEEHEHDWHLQVSRHRYLHVILFQGMP